MHFHGVNGHVHDTKICNWFHSVAYQHKVFKTKDGNLFKISVDSFGRVERIPYSINGAMETSGKAYDTSEHKYSQIVQLVGTPYDNFLIGNDLNQRFNGGKVMTGSKMEMAETLILLNHLKALIQSITMQMRYSHS